MGVSNLFGSATDLIDGNSGDFVSDTVGNAAGAVGTATGNPWIGPAISGTSSLVGGLMTNSANAAQAGQQENFQANMSNTSYQRGMADMEAAGLNPILAATNGGASTPAGASAVIHDPVTPAINSAMSVATQQANLDQTRAIIDNLHSTNDQIRSQTALNQANSAVAVANAANTQVDTSLKASNLPAAKIGSDIAKDPVGKAIVSAGQLIGDVVGPTVNSVKAAFH